MSACMLKTKYCQKDVKFLKKCHPADAYCASKFAVEGLTEAMATTLPQTGVDVSLVEPGGTATHLTRTMQLSVQELVRKHVQSCACTTSSRM